MPRSFRFGVARKSDLICSLVLLRCIAIVPTTSAQTAAEAAGATSLSTTYVAPATKAVGIASHDIQDVDLKNESQLLSFINVHAEEHRDVERILGI